MPSFFEKFKAEFRRQTPTFRKAAQSLFGGRKLEAESIEDLEEALYGADFGVETTSEIIDEIQEALKKDKSLRGQDALNIGGTVLRRVLAGAGLDDAGRFDAITEDAPRPQVLCLVGVNGSGKTTTAAKLARRLQDQGQKVVLGACDTFRAAANEQLKTWADRLGVDLVASHHGADSASVAFDAYAAAQSRKADLLILDTAGRLHTKSNLMEELRKIRRVLQKQDPTAPHASWIVIDGSIGTNSIEQARVFHQEFGLTGLVVTKLDGTSRGGALVGIYRELGLPIAFVGLGEKPEDLKAFDPEAYVEAIFGSQAE
ncbi:MAG: signal recognition particle-docking protein FtsY [Opitutales bacterium]